MIYIPIYLKTLNYTITLKYIKITKTIQYTYKCL